MQLLVKSLSLCLDILQDMIFYELKQDEDRMAIKAYLMNINILNCLYVKSRSQVILCCLIGDDDHELFPQLCVKERVVTNMVQELESHDNILELLTTLQKIKSLTKVQNNSILLKRHKILPLLESLMEMYPETEVENLLAELICHLLSDSFSGVEGEQDPFENFEKFMTACFKGNVKYVFILWLKLIIDERVNGIGILP